MDRNAARRAILGAALGLLAASRAAMAAPEVPNPSAFGAALEAALPAGAAAVDRLWAPDARDESRRMMDIRTSAMFLWTDVRVETESVRELRSAPDGAARAAVVTRTHGTATWRGAAWGVAQSFWTLQTDERQESNPVVRREEWALERRGDAWLVIERRELGVLDLLDVRLTVDAYPGQDALLVEGAYYVRALADSVRFVRFLLDRRAAVYDLRVDGRLAPVVRGNELGSLGLGGFSPELESSFEFPEPLASGEEALVTFRLRSPLVHMSEPGYVTSLPLTEGAFRERLWMPVLRPARAAAPDSSEIEVALRWPRGVFDRAGVAAPSSWTAATGSGEETGSVVASWSGDVRDVDFALLAAGVELPGALARWIPGGPGVPARLQRADPPPASALRVGRRERAAVLAPLLATTEASRDLGTELQELLPLDDDLMDELFDDSATDAERGADDRAAN